MKKFLIVFIICLVFICINIFSTSFGNEENNEEIVNKTESPIPSTRNSQHEISKSPFRAKY